MKQLLNDLSACVLGLIIINLQVLGIFQLLSNKHDFGALYLSLGGSFCLFVILRLINKFRLINQLLGLGIVCGFVGSFVVALLYQNYKTLEHNYRGINPLKITTIEEIERHPDQKVFKTNQAKPALQFSMDYLRSIKNQHFNYVVIPVHGKGGTDSLRYFAGFCYTDAILSNSKAELINFISSPDATIWRYRDTADFKYLRKALSKSVSKNKYQLSAPPIFLEFRDINKELNIAWIKFRNFFLATNAIWILFSFLLITKKRKEE